MTNDLLISIITATDSRYHLPGNANHAHNYKLPVLIKLFSTESIFKDIFMISTIPIINLHEPVKSVAQERLEKLHARTAEVQSSVSYHLVTNPSKSTSTAIEPKLNNTTITNYQQTEIVNADLFAATGTTSMKYGNLLLSQTISGFATKNSYDATTISNAVHQAMLSMAPRDEYEGMLCSRLLVLHDQYMNFLSKSASATYDQSIDLNINRSMKLMRIYNETLDALNKYRRKGEQKITIQHVNVNNGGQAIVASDFTQGGSTNKNNKE